MLNELIKKYYQRHRDWYFENSAKEIGIWIEDGKNSHWKNEKEIEEQAKRSFAENFSKIEFDFLLWEQREKLAEEIYNIIN